MKFFAQFISWVFLPLFMPIYGLLIAMYVPSFEASFFQEETIFWMGSVQKILILSMYMLFSVVVPGLSLLVMYRRKNITTIEMDDKNERSIPIIITAIYCAFLGTLLLMKAPDSILPNAIYALPWGGFIAIVIAGIINRKEKISLHALGAGMLLGFLVSYYKTQVEFEMYPIYLAVLVGGFVLSSRMYLGKHTLRQSISGYGLGFIVVYLMVTYFPNNIN
jgi:membrane-associated phospholipid phosphatase